MFSFLRVLILPCSIIVAPLFLAPDQAYAEWGISCGGHVTENGFGVCCAWGDDDGTVCGQCGGIYDGIIRVSEKTCYSTPMV